MTKGTKKEEKYKQEPPEKNQTRIEEEKRGFKTLRAQSFDISKTILTCDQSIELDIRALHSHTHLLKETLRQVSLHKSIHPD
jgi:hypothetical protein